MTFDPAANFAQAPYGSRPGPLAGVTDSERTYATFLHLSLLAALMGLPIVVALIMWLVKREESAFINDHGKDALNFQISLVVYMLVSGLAVLCGGLGFILIAGVYILGLIGMIYAAMAANRGELYRYPATMRIVR